MSEARKRVMVGCCFLIALAIGVYALNEDERPSLSWMVLLCGAWTAGAWLWPVGVTISKGLVRILGAVTVAVPVLWAAAAFTEAKIADMKWEKEAAIIRRDMSELASYTRTLQRELAEEKSAHAITKGSLKAAEQKLSEYWSGTVRALNGNRFPEPQR